MLIANRSEIRNVNVNERVLISEIKNGTSSGESCVIAIKNFVKVNEIKERASESYTRHSKVIPCCETIFNSRKEVLSKPNGRLNPILLL